MTGQVQCRVCDSHFMDHEMGSPTICLKCVRTCEQIHEAHANDFDRDVLMYTPEREARVERYEWRAKRKLPLFEDCA